MKKHPQEKVYLEKISKGKLPTHYLKPRNKDTEEDSSRILVKKIEIEDYFTKQYWVSAESIKPLCKMIKCNHEKKR